MRLPQGTVLCGIALLSSASAFAETPAEIFHEMDSRKRASLDGVDNFSVMKTTLGMCSLEHYQKATTASTDGRGTVAYMRRVPISEVMERSNPDSPFANASAEELQSIADTLRREGANADQEVRNQMGSAGIPPAVGSMIMNPPANEPWLSPMPGAMMGNYATLLEAGAKSKKQDAALRADQERQAQQDPLATIGERTRIVGRETLNGRPAIHLVAEDLNSVQEADDQQFTLNSLHLWVDAEKYVSLKMRMEGIASQGGETRDMRIEREDQGYRTVAGCGSLYEPLRSVMRISGVLSAAEQAKMDEAAQKLAQFESQMASLPQAQRDMIMRQMGPQMETMRKMVSGQGIEVETLTTGMRCNAGLPTREEYTQTVPGLSQGACIGFVD